MLLQISWRNIWRNPLRSGLIIVAIALGIWAAVFTFAFSFGMMESRTRDILETQISHVQFHHPEFEREDPGSNFLPLSQELIEKVENDPATLTSTARYLANGILNSTKGRKGTFPVQILGIQPANEAEVTSLDNRIIAGGYFEKEGRRVPEVVIGKSLAEEIGALTYDESGKEIYDFKRKITLSNIQLPNSSSAAIRVKIGGIYKAQNSQLEKLQVFINKDDLLRKLNLGTEVHEIAALIQDGKTLSKEKKVSYQKDLQESQSTVVKQLTKKIRSQSLIFGSLPSVDEGWTAEVVINKVMSQKMQLMQDSAIRTDRTYKISGFSLNEEDEKTFTVYPTGIIDDGDVKPAVYMPKGNMLYEADLIGKPMRITKAETEKIKNIKLESEAKMVAQTVKVESWSDLAPEIEVIDNQFSSSMRIFVIIILLALGFGIVNTMLMAILERTRELGMLMSIGMNKAKVFTMIMLETVMMTFIGAPIGMALAALTISYTGQTGIDLSGLETGAEFGMSSMVYPSIPITYYGEVAVMVIIAGILAAIYPSLRAIRLKPAEAVRAI
ncbi:MAG: FtsX-like permease family protein [Bacteroidota bacterium]